MPELPEVEIMRLYLEEHCLNKEIQSIACPPKDIKVLRPGLSKCRLAIKDQAFQTTMRWGKYLFVESNQYTWVFHFGMTSELYFSIDSNEMPKHSRVVFSFKEGTALHFISQRKFGFVDLAESADTYIKKKELGPDAFHIPKKTFVSLFYDKPTLLKPYLLNQKIIAGLGNWIVDELLFRNQLHPATPLNDLSNKSIAGLYISLDELLNAAIEHKTNKGNFPEHWFVPRRVLGAHCPRCGAEIVKEKYGGRGSYFCPLCQAI